MRIKNGMNEGVFIKRWDDSLYSTKFWVIITKQLEDFKPLFKKITKQDLSSQINSTTGAFCQALLDPTQRQNIMVVFTEDATIAYIVHEAVHVVNSVFLHHGVKLDPENDEHQAYYTDHIVSKILDAFKEFDQYKIKKEKVNNARKRKKR